MRRRTARCFLSPPPFERAAEEQGARAPPNPPGQRRQESDKPVPSPVPSRAPSIATMNKSGATSDGKTNVEAAFAALASQRPGDHNGRQFAGCPYAVEQAAIA